YYCRRRLASIQINSVRIGFAFFISCTPEVTSACLHASGERSCKSPNIKLWMTKGSGPFRLDRKSTRLNSSHVSISYAVFCLKKKKDKRKLGEVRSRAKLPDHE